MARQSGSSSSWAKGRGPLIVVIIVLLLALVWVVASAPSAATAGTQEKVRVVVVPAGGGGVGGGGAGGAVQEVKPNKLPSYFSEEYQQVGILTSPTEREGGDPMILPLFGRRMERHHRWQYYAAGEKPQHLWRVAVHVNGRECEETVGCPEILNGDTVNVPVYPNRTFVASMYKLDAPKYFADRY